MHHKSILGALIWCATPSGKKEARKSGPDGGVKLQLMLRRQRRS
jgi:hypothetical protein